MLSDLFVGSEDDRSSEGILDRENLKFPSLVRVGTEEKLPRPRRDVCSCCGWLRDLRIWKQELQTRTDLFGSLSKQALLLVHFEQKIFPHDLQ